MKKATVLILALCMLVGIMQGCTSAPAAPDSSKTAESSAATSSSQDSTEDSSPAAITEFAETFPDKPVMAGDDAYAYDDMSKSYNIELLATAYIHTKVSPDPVQENLEKELNVKLTYTSMAVADLEAAVTTRFAAGNAPDVMKLAVGNTKGKTIAAQLFNEGMTLPGEEMLPYMPTVAQYVTSAYKNYVTDPASGKMFAITKIPHFPTNWGYYYRTDWLKKFDMKIPETRDEIIAYAKACTFDDPDGNGVADTWFMGTAGGGVNFRMMEPFRSMFGHPHFNAKDGKINHPNLDGTSKEFVLFIKELYDAKTLAPDWYTTDWERFKSYSLNDQIGMVNYPGSSLLGEYFSAKQRDPDSVEIWAPLTSPPTATAGTPGKYDPAGYPDGIFIFNADLKDDLGKLKRVAHLLDYVQYPNEGFFNTQHAGRPELYEGLYPYGDQYTIEYYPDTGKYAWDISEMDPEFPALGDKIGLHDWQAFCITYVYKVYVEKYYGEKSTEYDNLVSAMPRWELTQLSLNLDPTVESDMINFQRQNEIDFVTGARSMDTWDTYVQEWLDRGGEVLLNEAASQLGVTR